jgi:hypothetical protein
MGNNLIGFYYFSVKGVTFRRILAEQGYDFEALKTIWFDKKKVILYFVMAMVLVSNFFLVLYIVNRMELSTPLEHLWN